MKVKTKPYGSWPSPLSATVAAQISEATPELQVDIDNQVYHLQSRPEEGGRAVIVHTSSKTDVVPKGWNIRTRVHEYGGGSWKIEDGRAIFTTFEGGVYEVFRSKKGQWSPPRTILEANTVHRFADFDIHPYLKHLVLAILEDHTIPAPTSKVVNSLVLINTTSNSFTIVESGRDFYTYPRWSPDGRLVSYVSWNFPDMPFEGSELFVGAVSTLFPGHLFWKEHSGQSFWKEHPTKIAGQLGDQESVSQPAWMPNKPYSNQANNTLVFLSDRSGFHNFYFWDEGTKDVLAVTKESFKHDFCGPAWQIGMSEWSPLDEDTFIATQGSMFLLFSISERNIISSFRASDPSLARFSVLRRISSTSIAFSASSHLSPPVIGTIDFSDDDFEKPIPEYDIDILSEEVRVLASSYVSFGKDIEFDTEDNGLVGGKIVKGHGIFYPPKNPKFIGLEDEKPPLIVHCHGGPTSSAGRGFSAQLVQYFTTRGFAVFDIDYGGSTGYGKQYRQRLKGNWGIVDIRDCQNAVLHLSRVGLIDASRVGVTGGSAGGFATLACLATGWKGWSVGVSYYGVSDLRKLAEDTHKFESRYLDKLVGGTTEEVPQVWKDRSPIFNVEKINAPLLLLQGLEDKVVPPPQAIEMRDSLKSRGIRVALFLFKGEGHGFRMKQTVITSKVEETRFYRSTWGIEAEEDMGLIRRAFRAISKTVRCA
ncbi:alpha/beta-hydrolase [Atractiella rhizophila]|nr:alpha/beta-hydrolase [Atractiella rhizophila]